MTITNIHAEHRPAEHAHSADCGHQAVEHVDYLLGTHRHAENVDHYNEHESVAEHTPAICQTRTGRRTSPKQSAPPSARHWSGRIVQRGNEPPPDDS